MIDTRRMQAKALFAQIEEFLKREPVPRTESKVFYSLKFDKYGDERVARERWMSLGVAIRSCDAYLEELKNYKGLWAGYGELIERLINRKDGLLKEIEQSEIVGISPVEKKDFGVDAQSFQNSFEAKGFGMDQPLPTPKATSGKMKQELSGANEKIIQCSRCSAFVRIYGTPPATLPGQTGPQILIPLTYCPVCGHPIARGTSAERVRI